MSKNKNKTLLLSLLSLIIILVLVIIVLVPTSSNIKANIAGSRTDNPYLFQCKCVYNKGLSTWPETLTIKLHKWNHEPSYSEKENICTQDCTSVVGDSNVAGML